LKSKSRKLIDIDFVVEGKRYQASVFLSRPTAIVIPDQNILALTSIAPKPDSSFDKNRYQKTIEPTERQEARIQKRQAKKGVRTILDETGKLYDLVLIKRTNGEPFFCECRHLVIAIATNDVG